jgi:hypothetical protein
MGVGDGERAAGADADGERSGDAADGERAGERWGDIGDNGCALGDEGI